MKFKAMPNRRNQSPANKDEQFVIWFKLLWGGILSVALILLMI